MFYQFIINFLKGLAMGAANVIPGVSGGTIALITGIFERLINAIKSIFGLKSLKLFFSGKFSRWTKHTDFFFLLALGLGILCAVMSLAKILEFLFIKHPVFVWAFFFGLVLASVWSVAKTITKWNIATIIFFILGVSIALGIAILKPMGENKDVVYLILSGAVAACSMILPGLSGSFILVLMGNYELVMIRAVNALDITVLAPVIIGAGIGLLAFSYILSWIFKNFRNQTISLLSGFMLGSLLIIWPWKNTIWKINTIGEYILDRKGEKIIERYIWGLPASLDKQTLIAISLIIIGAFIVYGTEFIGMKKNKQSLK